MVLGVGVAITLAAWTDTEVATGSFQAGGNFGIEATKNGADWLDYSTTETALALSFGDSAIALKPSEPVYAKYGIRLKNNSAYYADIEGAVTNNSGALIAGLEVEYKELTSWSGDCSATTTDGFSEEIPDIDLVSAKETRFICIKITPQTSIAASQQGTLTWTFTATSTGDRTIPQGG